MKRNLLMCMFICCFGFVATSCEKEKGEVIDPIVMDEPTQTLVEKMCNSLGVYSIIETDGLLRYNEILIIDSQEKLEELAGLLIKERTLLGERVQMVIKAA